MAPTKEGMRLKAELLAEGVLPTSTFLKHYGAPFLEKRRAYGNPDALSFRRVVLPQELYVLPDRLVCAVNVRQSSHWKLDWSESLGFVVHPSDWERATPITFPHRPAFYDAPLRSGAPVSSVITLYGGGSLGIFVYGSCSLVDMGKPCAYCSIAPNRSQVDEFAHVVDERALSNALDVALTDASVPIGQVMINGGNFRDLDRSFRYYARLVAAARRAIERAGRSDVELHLIVFPPNDHQLFGELSGLDVHVAMNCEVHDEALFNRHCPGKLAIGGKRALLSGLEDAVKVLGPGHVYSIFVGGLEPVPSLERGLELVAGLGATPIINVFHADPETPLAAHPVASREQILAMGAALQGVYERHAFMRPFYADCGRNSIDTEAHRRLFN